VKHEVRQKMADGQTVTMVADMKRKAVRVRHPFLRSCIFSIYDPSILYPAPIECSVCEGGIKHTFKTHHLVLDAEGYVTLSEETVELFRANGILEELVPTKTVVPRPYAIGLGLIDYQGQVLPAGGGPAPARAPQVLAWQPPDVISREEGVVKRGGIPRRNAVQPPADRFRQNPDGTWSEIQPS
jgi:hypothetical protein